MKLFNVVLRLFKLSLMWGCYLFRFRRTGNYTSNINEQCGDIVMAAVFVVYCAGKTAILAALSITILVTTTMVM